MRIVVLGCVSVGLLLGAVRAAEDVPPGDRDAVEVAVRRVVGTPQQGYRVVLKSRTLPARFLTIYIGSNEARAIWLKRHDVKTPRPMTHDLLHRAVRALGAKVEEVEVTKLENGTFFAEVTLSLEGKPIRIDARPSDSIALALRAECPIRVSRSVLRKAGSDRPEGPPDELKRKPEPPVDAI